MLLNKNKKLKKKFLGFLKLRIISNNEANLPISKKFLKRYKKLNKKAFVLTKLHKKNEE